MIPTKATLLSSKLSELQGIWLQPLCQECDRVADLACVVLGFKHGKQARLRDVLGRLKCSVCGTKPSLVKAADQPVPPEHLIGKGTWVIPLVP
ncbi:MAG: hypothetical protein ABW321_19315 [Polyangiales bacterium]